jgi:hypothetical protein
VSIHDVSNVTNVHTALREATAALANGRRRDGAQAHLSPPACELLARDLADTVDAVVRLLRTAGIEAVPTSSISHDLQAIVQELVACATLAHRVAGAGSRIGFLSQPAARWPAGACPDD